MVMACCERCYKQYLNESGKLSKEGLNETFGKDKYKIIKDDNEKIVKVGFREIKLCTCICHREGCMVMH